MALQSNYGGYGGTGFPPQLSTIDASCKIMHGSKTPLEAWQRLLKPADGGCLNITWHSWCGEDGTTDSSAPSAPNSLKPLNAPSAAVETQDAPHTGAGSRTATAAAADRASGADMVDRTAADRAIVDPQAGVGAGVGNYGNTLCTDGWWYLACTSEVHPIGSNNVTDFLPPQQWNTARPLSDA